MVKIEKLLELGALDFLHEALEADNSTCFAEYQQVAREPK
jgi:hypothetical protein